MATATTKAPVKTVAKAAPVAAKAAAKPAPAATRSPAAKPAAAAAAPKLSPLQKKLLAMREAWNNNKAAATEQAQQSGGTTLPPGVHVCQLTDIKLIETSKGAQALFIYEGIEGDEVGKKAEIWHKLEDEEKIFYLQKDLVRLGVSIDEIDPTELEQLFEEIKAAAFTVRISIKEKDGYTNAYLDRLVDTENVEGDDTAGEAEEATEEEGAAEEATEEEIVDEATAEEEAVEEEAVEEEAAAEEEPAAEEEALEYIPSPGDKCKFAFDGKKYIASIASVDMKKEVAKFNKQKDGKTPVVPFADLEEMAVAE